MQQVSRLRSGSPVFCVLILCQLYLISCGLEQSIPTVSDDPIELMVRSEAARIIAVSEDKDHISEYQIFLSDFPRKDILGMSVGNRRIYISHQLAKLASTRVSQLWLLRQTLAHEIAHETAGHARQSKATNLNRGAFASVVSNVDVGLPWYVTVHNYSAEKELQADAKGLEYWEKLGWDCRIWVAILENFQSQNYAGDALHPTDKRLRQAEAACRADGDPA